MELVLPEDTQRRELRGRQGTSGDVSEPFEFDDPCKSPGTPRPRRGPTLRRRQGGHPFTQRISCLPQRSTEVWCTCLRLPVVTHLSSHSIHPTQPECTQRTPLTGPVYNSLAPPTRGLSHGRTEVEGTGSKRDLWWGGMIEDFTYPRPQVKTSGETVQTPCLDLTPRKVWGVPRGDSPFHPYTGTCESTTTNDDSVVFCLGGGVGSTKLSFSSAVRGVT